MLVELWLLWTLKAGQPVDVDSFLTKESCETSLLEGNARLDQNKLAAKAGGAPKDVLDVLNSLVIYGCTPAKAGFKQDAG